MSNCKCLCPSCEDENCTSIVKYITYDGTEETLPAIGEPVIVFLARITPYPYEFRLTELAHNKTRGMAWKIGIGARKAEIGDKWANVPRPEVKA